MRATLVSPRIAFQKGDFLGSGIPYWPVELATLASYLRENGHDVTVIDLFGSGPDRLSDQGDYYLQGLSINDFLHDGPILNTDIFILYALSYMSHKELLGITRTLKEIRPNATVAILENSQAVTAYSIERVSTAFFEAGADALICGEAIINWNEIEIFFNKGGPVPTNIMTPEVNRHPQRRIAKDIHYPIPAWDLFNLTAYWSLPYSHGPKTSTFLPILTSRGCPYPCDFCVVPETNSRRWRPNTPADVVEEIITLRDRFNVYDFQIEDLNPTVDFKRWEEICRLLIARKANIRFYIVSGTKAETVHVDQIPLFAKAGCRYISISPESGSEPLMKVIGKKFNYDHGIKLVTACRTHGIRTQACFLVGHPSETDEDFRHSRDYLKALVRAGLDEVAVFIVAPFAGSQLFSKNNITLTNSEALVSFSPKGRADHKEVNHRRQALIRLFFAEKLLRGFDIWLQGLRAILGKPETKMENLPRRIAYILYLVLKFHLTPRKRQT